MDESTHTLPRPTDRTRLGPRINAHPGSLEVSYDWEADDGTIEWCSVHFEDVLQVELRADSCCSAGDVAPCRELRVSTDSERLIGVVALWEARVGGHDWQRRQGGRERFRHFSLYFDDSACVDVVAASARVSGT